MKDNKARTTTVDDDISKRIDSSHKLLARLKQVQPAPLYARSILQSAIHNKTRVLEAHLSTMSDSLKARMIDEQDEDFSRSAAFYSAYYGNVDALELLSASDAKFNMTDRFSRTCLHYGAMTNNSKAVEAIFMAFKA